MNRTAAGPISTPDMTSNDGGGQRGRWYKWKYGPLRLIMPWVCVIVGIGLTIKGIASSEDDGATFIALGVGFIVLGAAAALIARWMAKRGI